MPRGEDARLVEAVASMFASLDPEDTARAVLMALAELVEAEAGALLLVEAGGLRPMLALGSEGPRSIAGEAVEDHVCRARVEACRASGELEIVANVTGDPRARGDRHVEAAGVASLLVAPILVEGQVAAVVELDHETPGHFRDDRGARVEGLLGPAGRALANAAAHRGLGEALRQQNQTESRLRAIIDNSRAVVFLKDLEGRYVLVNRELERATGMSRSEILGRDDEALFSPRTAARLREDDRRVLDSGEALEFEGVTDFPGGPRVFVTRKFPLRDDAGRIYALCGVSTDITTRKLAEEAIAAREHDLRVTFDAIGDALISMDGAGRIRRMNPAAERLTGWTQAEAEGRAFAEVVVIEDGDSGGYARLHDRAGQERRVTHSLAPICDAGGEIRQVAVIRDVGERLELEEQLRRSQKLDAVGQLAAGVAQDFNNVLAAILGAADLLDAALPATRSDLVIESLAQIVASSERAAELTRKLLAFSRRTAGDGQELLDLHRLLATVVTLLRPLLDDRVEIQLRLEARASMVLGDAALLQSALINLGVNAGDAMAEGGCLELRTRSVEIGAGEGGGDPVQALELPPGPYLVLGVADSGPGIDEDIRARVFEPFFTTKAVGEGSGLGLAVVHGAVEAHSGAIRVGASEQGGALFEVLLPAVEEGATLGRGEGVRNPEASPT